MTSRPARLQFLINEAQAQHVSAAERELVAYVLDLESSKAPGCDPVGAVEIAARLGVKRGTVDMWRHRDLGFPEPRWTVGGRPAWDWPDVKAWHEART